VKYWYNVDRAQVEDDTNRSRNENVLGPYDTREEAEQALAQARANTEKWDAEDKAWNDEGLED
jgi:hypothetical protein